MTLIVRAVGTITAPTTTPRARAFSVCATSSPHKNGLAPASTYTRRSR
ncbi:hypothetical protein [Streptomyces sp. NRRL S-1448]|nr:hypothetical protein [Streptomyces sp. NRRL S-1448]